MNGSEEDVNFCPSFSSYTTDRLAETAEKVAAERWSSAAAAERWSSAAAADEGEDDFEFARVHEDDGEVTVDDFFRDGQIREVFPVFNRDLVLEDGGGELPESSIAIPLSRLFIQEDRERDCSPSYSSSEADELENIPAGTYCVWRPKVAEAPMPSHCRKSKSTGSASRRWKLRDLLRRCKSDGKDIFVFLTPKLNKEENAVRPAEEKHHRSPAPAPVPASAHEAFYVRNKAMKEGGRKKSYLPYRQELVGFFANAKSPGKSFPRF